MIYLSIFAFVLALAAVACGVAAWITSARLTREQASWRSATGSALRKLSESIAHEQRRTKELLRELEAQSPKKLAAEVAELSEAVARLADTHRRFAGRFHATVAKRDTAAAGNGASGDEELDALLRLQAAPAVSPGS